MTQIVQRNVTAARLADADTAPPTFTDELELRELAGAINNEWRNFQGIEQEAHAIYRRGAVSAARMGEAMSKAKDMIDVAFDTWLENNCPQIKRSQAYNYMRIARENPGLLAVQSTGQPLLSITQYTALFGADDGLKQEVQARVEAGENVSVREIERLKRENARLEEREKNWKEHAQIAKTEAAKARATLLGVEQETEARAVELASQHLESRVTEAMAELERDYQAKIDSQTDQICRLKNDLAKHGDEARKQQLQQEIQELQERMDSMRSNRLNERIVSNCNQLDNFIAAARRDLHSINPDDLKPSTREMMLRCGRDMVSMGMEMEAFG